MTDTQTAFCTHCGYVFARGNDAELARARRESPYSACPGCGATKGVGFVFGDASQEDILSALNPDHRIVARPGESPQALADRMMREVTGQTDYEVSRELAKRWLIGIALTMLIVGGVAAGVTYYLYAEWGRAAAFGLAAAFVGALIADRFLPSPLR